MESLFHMLHIIGIVLWFGGIVIDVYFLPAAKKEDARHQAWVYGLYTRALTLEIAGLALLLTGGIGMLVVEREWPWDARWLLVKIVAAAVLILSRVYVYVFMYRRFSPAALSKDEAGLESHMAASIAAYDRNSRIVGAISLVSLVVLLVMVFWKPI